MSFEILHFRGSDKILEEKNMSRDVRYTMEYLDSALYGTYHRREILRQALDDMDWRTNGDLNILEGRRYFYKGFKKRVAIDGNFSSYEFILDGLLRLQIGFDKGKIDMGILLLTAQRSEKSPYGSTKQLVEQEVKYLEPTITLPVTVVLFDLGSPGSAYEEKDNAENSSHPGSHENPENEIPDPAVVPVGNVPPVDVVVLEPKKKRGRRKKVINDLTHENVRPK